MEGDLMITPGLSLTTCKQKAHTKIILKSDLFYKETL